MKCYELKDDVLQKGLRIIDAAGPPHVRLTEEISFPLDAFLTEGFRSRRFQQQGVRQIYASFSKDKTRLVNQRRNDQLALVRLYDKRENGTVSLSACAYDEDVNERAGEVEKLYRPFPSQGIQLLGDHPEPGPWVSADHLELAILMIPKSSLRITREGPLHGARPHTYLYWNGYEMFVTPKHGKPNERHIEDEVAVTRRRVASAEVAMAAQ